jgi:hypothetical protein
MRTMLRRAWVIVAMVICTSSPSQAEPSIDECVASAEGGQRQRDGGRYLAARQALVMCSAPSCPTAIAHDCQTWLEDLERKIPSIVVSVRDERGQDVLGARVSIDGVPIEQAGAPVSLDPGEHFITAEAQRFETSRTGVVVMAGEKNRIVVATVAGSKHNADRGPLAGEGPDRAQVADDGRSWFVPLVLGGVGALSLGGSLFFGLEARSDLSKAKASPCAATSSCDEGEGRSIDRRLVVADVLLGVGVVALASAGAWLLFHRPAPPPRAARGGGL